MKRVLYLFIVLCTTSLCAEDIWDANNIVVDGWSVGQYTSLAILPSAQPAISYYDYIDGDLEYTWFENGNWYTTTVDNLGNVGSHTSLAILPSGQPAISYFDHTNSNLKYAELVGENPSNPDHWMIITIDNDAAEGYTSLAILPSGQPAISYAGPDSVKYAWLDDVGWHIDIVDTVSVDGGQTSLAILPSGNPVISYFDGANLDLKYAEVVMTSREGSLIWDITTVDGEDGKAGMYNNIAILPSGNPAICYYSITGRDLKYAWLEEDIWHTTIIDSDGHIGTHCSLAILPEGGTAANCLGGSEQIDLSGQPVISYSNAGGNDLYFTWFDGISWQKYVVDTPGNTGTYTSIAILPCGKPAISYHNRGDGTLKYAWFEGFGWYTTTVDPGKWVGEYTSLAFLPSGKPVISYWKHTNLDLMCAELIGEDPSDPKQWQTLAIEYDRNVGEYTSIEILQSGQPAISYYSRQGQDLKYAWFDGSEWQTTIIDNPSQTGQHSSLAISPITEQPAISYLSNHDLRYAWFDGSAWHSGIVVDGEGDVGYHTNLAFLPSGKPVISYRNNTNQELMYAELVGENPSDPNDWLTMTIDSDDNVGQHTSIAIWNGQPMISYYDATNQDLKLAWFDGNIWQMTTVDDGLNTGTYSSLAIVFDKPAISYYSDGDLKYAELISSNPTDPMAWNINIIDTGGGMYTSLVTMPSGQPAISYYHESTGDLKYAYRFSQ